MKGGLRQRKSNLAPVASARSDDRGTIMATFGLPNYVVAARNSSIRVTPTATESERLLVRKASLVSGALLSGVKIFGNRCALLWSDIHHKAQHRS
jgi:hypothetical protein